MLVSDGGHTLLVMSKYKKRLYVNLCIFFFFFKPDCIEDWCKQLLSEFELASDHFFHCSMLQKLMLVKDNPLFRVAQIQLSRQRRPTVTSCLTCMLNLNKGFTESCCKAFNILFLKINVTTVHVVCFIHWIPNWKKKVSWLFSVIRVGFDARGPTVPSCDAIKLHKTTWAVFTHDEVVASLVII